MMLSSSKSHVSFASFRCCLVSWVAMYISGYKYIFKKSYINTYKSVNNVKYVLKKE